MTPIPNEMIYATLIDEVDAIKALNLTRHHSTDTRAEFYTRLNDFFELILRFDDPVEATGWLTVLSAKHRVIYDPDRLPAWEKFMNRHGEYIEALGGDYDTKAVPFAEELHQRYWGGAA